MNATPHPFTVIGHRGARGHSPENTLLSIETAIGLGADWIEIDVQHHAGELWLMHDLTLDRTTNAKGVLTAHSADALRAIDAGRGERIPTLQQTLDRVDRRAGINIELKSWDGCAEAVADCLRDAIASGWPAERFLVSSFHLPELQRFHTLLPEVPIGALYCGVPLTWAREAQDLGAQAVNISDEFVDPKLIDDAHTRGLKLYVYTVNDPERVRELQALGADGVFSDYPDRALDAVRR